MTDELPLQMPPGLVAPRRLPRVWGISLEPVAAAANDGFPGDVRVTLIDRETGRRVGARMLPWEEFRVSATQLVLVNISEGVWE